MTVRLSERIGEVEHYVEFEIPSERVMDSREFINDYLTPAWAKLAKKLEAECQN